MDLPTLDLCLFVHGSSSERVLLAEALTKSLREHGFVKLVNHGISEEMAANVMQSVNKTASSSLNLVQLTMFRLLTSLRFLVRLKQRLQIPQAQCRSAAIVRSVKSKHRSFEQRILIVKNHTMGLEMHEYVNGQALEPHRYLTDWLCHIGAL